MAKGFEKFERLEGANHPTWRFKITVYLKAKGFWDVIEGDQPNREEELVAWAKKDREALNAIVQNLSTSQACYVINQVTAKGAWLKLQEANRGRVLERKMTLKRDLNGIKWTKDENAVQYMQRVEALGEQLRALGEANEDAEIASIAIRGLPRGYHGVAQAFDVCALADLTTEKVRYALAQEENRQNGYGAEAAHKARVTPGRGSGGKNSL
ncbi:uncharacterized protein LOC135389199 [Ornithodoros turicata]|uniref:uncharacterized protein LOC135389199 n=1 Tax=Ornithodoros turicata TaxID=34597 RepID=UPI00313A343C